METMEESNIFESEFKDSFDLPTDRSNVRILVCKHSSSQINLLNLAYALFIGKGRLLSNLLSFKANPQI